jgi:MOSC domain-containing protein YiiM
METMRISSVNTGRKRSIAHGKRNFTTGICKEPTEGPVYIGAERVDGDTICDLDNHGGSDQAVYAYSSDDYAWWSEQMGTIVGPGTFGENLTIDGLPTDLNIGDRLLIGDVLLEATAPRIPCSTLAARMQDQAFGIAFRRAERPGTYFRVLNAGEVEAGDAVTLVENTAPVATVLELYRFAFDLRPERADMERFLETPLAARMRRTIEEKLASLG